MAKTTYIYVNNSRCTPTFVIKDMLLELAVVSVNHLDDCSALKYRILVFSGQSGRTDTLMRIVGRICSPNALKQSFLIKKSIKICLGMLFELDWMKLE